MAIQETRQLPPKFIEELGTDLGTQLIAQSGRPTVAPGTGGITQLAGESADDFAARQQAAQEFDVRKQSIAGLAPTVAGQTAQQQEALRLAEQAAGTTVLMATHDSSIVNRRKKRVLQLKDGKLMSDVDQGRYV